MVLPGIQEAIFRNVLLVQADARHLPLKNESVHCVVTSPPYWGLRKYDGAGKIEIGQEQTLQEYVRIIVDVFKEVWRVLRNDGTCWLNLGDVYAGGGRAGKNPEYQDRHTMFGKPARHKEAFGTLVGIPDGLKPKDLCGVPWRVAFALQDAGWYLRSDIIWSKPSCMPSSTTDRPTVSHEYVFLLTKSPKYFYDYVAIRERAVHGGKQVSLGAKSLSKGQAAAGIKPSGNGIKDSYTVPAYRNKRSVWAVAPEPYRGAHYACFPTKLIEPMILAGTSEKGCCTVCRSPWKRVISKTFVRQQDVSEEKGFRGSFDQKSLDDSNTWEGFPRGHTSVETVDWKPSCSCETSEGLIPCTVLDPFGGTATVGVVALRHGRKAICVDASFKYLNELARSRLLNCK